MRKGGSAKRAEKPVRALAANGGTVSDRGNESQVRAACDENAGDETAKLMEEVLRRENLIEAHKRVKRNKGAPGVDGMTVDELMPYCREHWEEIRGQLLEETYMPRPIRAQEIPKPQGGTRMLGIPVVLDRLIMQAILQVLTPLYDPTFSESSHGFRPGRSTHDAIRKSQEFVNEGYDWVVDLDLEKFFDLSSQCTPAHERSSKSFCCTSITLIRKPFLFPRQRWTASSSPRFTRCNTV